MNWSSSLLLYAIYDPDRSRAGEFAQQGAPGVAERPVRSVECGSLAVLASSIPSEAPWIHTPSVETVLAFKSVIDRAFASGPVIPLRFGTVVGSASRASSVVAEKHRHYLSLLDRLEGHIEMGLRLTLGDDEPEGDPCGEAGQADGAGHRPGTSYLLERRKRMHRAQRRVERAVEPFRNGVASITTSTITSTSGDANASVSVAFLLPREQEVAFRSAVASITAPGVDQVDVVGPWPPYSFVQTTKA